MAKQIRGRHTHGVLQCLAIAMAIGLLTAKSFSEAVPKTQATTLSGQTVSFPTAGSEKPLLLVLGFSNKSSNDVTDWNKHFRVPYAVDQRVDFYELADFQGVPPFVMKMILHGMRRSVKEPERSHFAPFYADEEQWKKLVRFDNPKVAYVVLANAKGDVIWQTRGPASDAAAAQLEAEVVKLTSKSNTQQNVKAEGTLQRRYIDGAVSHYLMTGDNDGWHYTIQLPTIVRRDKNGRYYEEIGWLDLTSNAKQTLTPASLAVRQTVSLDDPASYMKVPNLANIQPALIGPITDALTFYSDLLLAMRAKLVQPGQTAYVARTAPNSWADGQRVLLGEDVVDFSLKVEAVDVAEQIETILIQHVPPPALHVQLPPKWMQQPASATPRNFVQVSKQDDGFIAETGKETFDVRLVVDARDGRVISATMHNPVLLTARKCTDRELNQCAPEVSKATLREITWKSIP